MSTTYKAKISQNIYTITEIGGNRYQCVGLFLVEGKVRQVTARAVLHAETSTLVIEGWAKSRILRNGSPEAFIEEAQQLPPWTLTRYLYLFFGNKDGKVSSTADGRLLIGEEQHRIVSTINGRTFNSVYRLLSPKPARTGAPGP